MKDVEERIKRLQNLTPEEMTKLNGLDKMKMKMKSTTEAKIELACAKTRVKEIAKIVNDPSLTEEEVFNILWNLAFRDLQKLEDFRII